MSSFQLKPASNFGSRILPTIDRGTEGGVTLAERSGVSLCSVLSRKGSVTQMAERVSRDFGIELPRVPRCTGAGRPVEFIWAGPNQWLVLGEGFGSRSFEERLNASLSGVASVTDQSDGRTILRIGGPRARDALAKGILIDLDPCAFRPGDTAITAVAYMNVHFWQIDALPTYEFAMFRSFSAAFWNWIVDAAAEYGVDAKAV